MRIITAVSILVLGSGFANSAEEATHSASKPLPHRAITDLAVKVLSENKGGILSPSLVGAIKPLDKRIGWKFTMKSPTYKGDVVTYFQYVEESNGNYIFEYKSNLSEKTHRYKWAEGYQYNSKVVDGTHIYQMQGEEACKFKVGECSFEGYDGKKKVMYTEYREGVWVRDSPMLIGRNRTIEMDIYDVSGFPLYHYVEPAIGHPVEEFRVDLD